MPFVVESSLNSSQFTKFMALVRRMVDHIESVQNKSLQEMEKMKAERDTLEVRFYVPR
jgi:hypothetical protein